VDRRRFLQTSVLGAAPAVLGVGSGTVLDRAADDDGYATRARSGRGLGVQRVVWSGTGDGVALTFDDGPDPELTPEVLDILQRAGIRATFMLVGERIAAAPDLVRRAVAEGHHVGNHTWSHRSLATLGPEEVREELTRTTELLGRIVPDADVAFFRPPRGILTGAAARVAADLGQDVLLWSCTKGPHLERGLREAGTVVCLHDGTGRSEMSRWPWDRGLRPQRRREIAALPRLLAAALDDGVRFVQLPDLVR
jgi:peptidoglycan/xylan/chitin deacetylase (PgdA/CDA1 family)